MKLTKSQEKKLRKKMKLKSSAEDVFVNMFISDVKNSIGKKIRNAMTINEVDEIIENINTKELSKYIKSLRSKVLKRNNEGFTEIIKAVTSGLDQLKKKKEDNKKFNKAMTNLIKSQKLVDPLLDKFEYNMSLIKNLPKDVYKLLRKGYMEGKAFRGTEIESELYERLGNRAKLIVRTESAKVNTAITEVRSRSVGVKAYMWSTSGDARVRDSHQMLDNVLVFWNDAVTFNYTTQQGSVSSMHGHCGEFPNCRCIPLAIFDLDDIHFPVRVAEDLIINTKSKNGKELVNIQSGRIATYTKTAFLKQYGKLFISDETELIKLLG
ncbi:MAG: phage minor head protein [Bacilli bacterium]